MSDIDKEKLKKEIADIMPEPKDYDEKIKNLEEKIEKATLTNLSQDSQKKNEGVLDEFPPHSHKDEHEHRVHSYDKTCPDCGDPNPDFDNNQYLCSSCGEPVGTKDEAIRSVACPHCGKNEGAENPEEGWTI